MTKILHKKILNTLNLYWYHNNAYEKINSLNGHSRGTLAKWMEVCHISCQVKFLWYNYVDELYYTRDTCDTIYLPIFKDAQAVQVFKKNVFVNNKLFWELRNKLFRKRQSYLMTVRSNKGFIGHDTFLFSDTSNWHLHLFQPRMIYLTGSSRNIYITTLALLLTVVWRF